MPLGEYQGIAEDHFVEFDLGAEIPRDTPSWLVANGWIYPTDSSINVAIGQGTRIQPRGLALEAQDEAGRWVVVSPDLGFPAGKNKTILIDLGQVNAAGVAHARRLRLRTNLEVYWDRLAVADAVERPALTTVAPAAERRGACAIGGFRRPTTRTGGLPEIPLYDAIANVAQRWRDLVGYHTRFGDVRRAARPGRRSLRDHERRRRAAAVVPRAGTARGRIDARFRADRRRLGEGRRLQHHLFQDGAAAAVARPAGLRVVSQRSSSRTIPAYRQHPSDWQNYHTRFVTPDRFLRGVR